MIHEKWVISDTHFYHRNTWAMFKKADGSPLRPFNSTDEMNMTMWNNWNKVVMPNDYVYHLGDVTFDYTKTFFNFFRGLNGHKRLILGNHDKIVTGNFILLFEKVELWKGITETNKLPWTMSHIPQRLESIRWGNCNIHGHTHDAVLDDPHYINVCVETRNYTPIHFDTIHEEVKQRLS